MSEKFLNQAGLSRFWEKVRAYHDADAGQLFNAEPYGPDDSVSFEGRIEGFPLRSCLVDIQPVQAGSGDPSPSNVRPISGWTGATVTRAGKNLLDISAIEANSVITQNGDGTITVRNASGTAAGYPASSWSRLQRYAPGLKVGKTCTLSGVSTAPSANQAIYLRGADMLWRFGESKRITEAMLDSLIYFYAGVVGGTAVISELQIEEGTVQTAYEPYQSDVYSVSWQTEAGTVYGGTLDVGTGVLTVTWIGVDVHDASPQVYNGIRYFRKNLAKPGIYPPATYVMSNVFRTSAGLVQDNVIYINSPGTLVMMALADTGITTAAQFNAFLDANNVQVVYRLAAPVTCQLVPQEVTALLGVNRVWADCGEVTVEHGAFLQGIWEEIGKLREEGKGNRE